MGGVSGRSVPWLAHPLAPGVRALSTLRDGVDDDYGWEGGATARSVLQSRLAGLESPRWLRQVHGIGLADLDRPDTAAVPVADAALTRHPGRVASVLTADCLPVFLATREGSAVAVVHAGWRGLAAGVIEAAVAAFGVAPTALCAAFGPAIGPQAFEVGPELRDCFLQRDPGNAEAFHPGRGDRWHADLYRLGQRALRRAGVEAPASPCWCTATDRRFHSWRRDGMAAGRMAHLIWREIDV